MESKRAPKNLKRPSTAFQPRSAILTRTKFRSYLLSQLESPSSKDLHAGLLQSPRKKPRRLANEFPPKDDELSQFIMKDLRTKRIFSPIVTDESRLSGLPEERMSEKERVSIAKGSCVNGDEGVEKNIEETARVGNSEFSNFKSSLTNGDVELGDENRRCNGNSKPVNCKDEEPTHSTPPDAEILGRNVLSVSADGCPRSSNGSVQGADKIDSLTKTRLMLKPCFKRKLIKAPGSIAYKRLLPYLLDNDTCILQDDPYPKRENSLQDGPCNCPREYSSVDSDTCAKNSLVSPPRHQILSFGKENDLVSTSHDKKLKENGGHANSPIENSSISLNTSAEAEAEASKLCVPKKFSNSVCENINRKDDSIEESLQMTLNSEISCQPVIEEKRDEDQNRNISMVNENHSNIDIASDRKFDFHPRNKLVRNPLSQLKFFRGLGSINYRRMLPFLEDLIKDNSENSFALRNLDCPREEESLATIHSPPPCLNSHNSPDISTDFKSCLKPYDGNSDTLSVNVLTTASETVCETEKSLTSAGDNNISCGEAYVLSENLSYIRKGILKRNPRGCRGICTCLNCSSFRLHAEKAFEFSRNQLLDAEEVALDLMKEVSYLRGLLEKSVEGACDAGHHLNKMKEASRKASEAEIIAKDRLVQMNYELDIHCRVTSFQRPNVKFSGDIQKRD